MHSATVEFEGEEYPYMVNGDYSGDIHLVVPGNLVEPLQGTGCVRVTLPFEVLEEIVGRKAAEQLVSFFENCTGLEAIKFLTSLES